MSCPEPIVLSRFADGDLADGERRDVDRHLRECEDCREATDSDELVARALGGKAVCPEPECLALFIDDALGPPRVDVVAAHVLVCDPCRSVVAWTREASLATERVGSKSGRRRTRVHARSAMPGWLPAVVGAAAAVLLVVLIARSDRRSTRPDQAHVDPRPTTTQSPPPTRTERAPIITPSATEPTPPEPTTSAPTTEVGTPVEPIDPTPVEPTTPPTTTESGPTVPPTTTTTTPTPTPPAVEPIQVAALPGGSLRFRDPSGAEGDLTGAAALAPGTRLLGGRQGGGLRMGGATCFVDGQSELRLRAPAPDRQAMARVELLDGQLTVDADGPSIEVACGPAIVRPTGQGVYMVVSADGPGRALLCVVTGEAEIGDLAAATAPSKLRAGESARVEGDRVRPVRGDARLARAEDLATSAALAQGVDFPGGVRVRRVLAAADADLSAGDVVRRAWASYAVLAVHRAGPRLARLADPHADAARRALTELLTLPPDATASAAVPLLLAAVANERHGLDQAAVVRLADTISSRPGAELVADCDALLALRAAERLTSFKAPRALWAAVAALPLGGALDGPAAGARAVLARRSLDATARKQLLADLDALLARDPLAQALEPRALLDAERSLVLLGASTDERRARVLGHAGAPDRTDALLALAAAHDTAAAVGLAEARHDDPASVVVTPQADGRFRVTFVFSSARRPKQVLLLGGWDQWAEPGMTMRERGDGTFTATIVLPAGRHEYKLRLGVGGVWEHDTQNPLMAADRMGGVNSVLVLE